jgi:hypothetical protein
MDTYLWQGKLRMEKSENRKKKAKRIVFDVGGGVKVSFPVKKKLQAYGNKKW